MRYLYLMRPLINPAYTCTTISLRMILHLVSEFYQTSLDYHFVGPFSGSVYIFGHVCGKGLSPWYCYTSCWCIVLYLLLLIIPLKQITGQSKSSFHRVAQQHIVNDFIFRRIKLCQR